MKKNLNRHLTRKLLLQAIYQWKLTGLEYQELLQQFEYKFDKIDVGYFKQALADILEFHNILLDEQAKHSNINVVSQEIIVQSILFISVYELKYKKDIPYKVVLNEALELSKEYGSKESYKFVNGLLDKLAQELRADEIKRHTETS